MKKISLILFSIVVIFCSCYAVLANSDGDGPGSDPVDLGKTKSVNSVPYTEPFGFRISFVTNTGQHILSIDYNVRDHSGYVKQNATIYALPTKYSKVTYITQGITVKKSNAVETTFKEGELYHKLSEFNKKLESYNFKKISNSSLSNLGPLQDAFSKANYNGDEANYTADMINLIKSFGVPERYLTEENLPNLFMVYEPLTMGLLAYKASDGEIYRKKYYGTAYEFIKFADQTSDSKTLGAQGWNCIIKTANACDLPSYTMRTLPCQAYLTGSLIAAMNDKNFNISGFSEGVYFGQINIVTTANNTCAPTNKDKRFDNEQVTMNYGVAMGVVWFSQYVEPPPPLECPQIHNISGYSSTKVGELKCDDVDSLVSSFNSKAKDHNVSTITNSWYRNNCGCQQKLTGYDCTPDYQIGTCENKTQITYDDLSSEETDFWNNCVYKEGEYTIDIHKTPTNSAYTYKDSGLTDNNRYCEVYCTENLETNFQVINANTKYNAGYHITWPTGSTVKGSRTCKVKLTQSAWNTYHSELETAVQSTLTNYNKYSEYDAKLDVLNTYTQTNETCGCKNSTTPVVSCYDITKMPEIEGGTIDPSSITLCSEVGLGSGTPTGKYSGYSITSTNKLETKKTVVIKETNPTFDEYGREIDNPDIPNTAEVTVTQYIYKLYKCTAWYKYYKSSTYSGSYKVYSSSNYDQDKNPTLSSVTKTFKYDAKICENTYNNIKGTVSSNRSAAYNNYTAAQANANAYIQQMQKCYTWSDETNKNKVYNLNPELYLSNVNTGYTIDSSLSKLDNTVIKDSYLANALCEENEDYYYVCNSSGSSCEKKTLTVKNCVPKNGELSLVTATYTKLIRYSLNSKLYRYVYKENNLSVNTIPNRVNADSYIYMPYGNIPIAYKTKDGTYDISFTYSKLGHQQSGITAIDKILENINPDDYGTWSCQYSITSKLIPEDSDHSGINVIYRTIDLKNPFPDIDGKGRGVGSNWCYNGDCSNTNSLVKRVITENKLPDEPMYSFVLTPSVIQRIRRYNKNTSYSDFDLKCEADTGKACVSEFLTKLINDEYGESSATGKYVNNPFCRVNKSNYFYGC